MNTDLDYVMKNLTGVIALIGIILTFLTIILESAKSNISNIEKSYIGKNSSSKKDLMIMVFFVIILFSEIVGVSEIYVQLINYFKICVGVIFIYLILLYISKRAVKKREKLIFSMENRIQDISCKNSSQLKAIISLLIIGAVDVASYTLSIFDNVGSLTRIGVLEIILFQTTAVFMVVSHIYYESALTKLKKYIIKTEQFEDGYIIALVISETNDEILIKCDYTYPIVLSKSKIDAYIDVSKLTDEEIGDILNKNKNGKYKGYCL